MENRKSIERVRYTSEIFLVAGLFHSPAKYLPIQNVHRHKPITNSNTIQLFDIRITGIHVEAA